MLIDINVAQTYLELNRLFYQNPDHSEVVAVYFRGLLSVEFDGSEEATPLNNLPCRYRQG
jgi:hypothetical protein